MRQINPLIVAIPCLLSSVCFAQAPSDQRYMLGLLDHRSRYGQAWFPEPLRAPEMDVDREFRIDYFHGESQNVQVNEVNAELEYNFGNLTIELEVPYERESESEADPVSGKINHTTSQGIGAIELAARHPVYQWVSQDGFADYTLAAAIEVAIPSGSEISKDTEIVPKIFQLLRLGEHFSLQAGVGYSAVIGPVDGGVNTLEYDLVLGWNLEQEDLRLPGVLRTIPIFELNGSRGLAGEGAGENQLFGTAGVRLNFESLGALQPRIGLGIVFPIDQGARNELNWGIVSSLVFEF